MAMEIHCTDLVDTVHSLRLVRIQQQHVLLLDFVKFGLLTIPTEQLHSCTHLKWKRKKKNRLGNGDSWSNLVCNLQIIVFVILSEHTKKNIVFNHKNTLDSKQTNTVLLNFCLIYKLRLYVIYSYALIYFSVLGKQISKIIGNQPITYLFICLNRKRTTHEYRTSQYRNEIIKIIDFFILFEQN